MVIIVELGHDLDIPQGGIHGNAVGGQTLVSGEHIGVRGVEMPLLIVGLDHQFLGGDGEGGAVLLGGVVVGLGHMDSDHVGTGVMGRLEVHVHAAVGAVLTDDHVAGVSVVGTGDKIAAVVGTGNIAHLIEGGVIGGIRGI